MKVLITGATGFVGRHLCRHLQAAGHEIAAFARNPPDSPGLSPSSRRSGPKWIKGDSRTDLADHLQGVEALVHAAGIAHRAAQSPEDEAEMHEINAAWTRRIAETVAGSETRLLVHISSIAVLGRTRTAPGEVLDEDTPPEPITCYGRSKFAAEAPVAALAEVGKTGINLRPPLIYGPDARGNWPRLANLAARNLPLPFQSVNNQRSFLGIGNLCDLVLRILQQPGDPASSGPYHVTDDGTCSLPEVIAALREARGCPARLYPCPPGLLGCTMRFAGRSSMTDSLLADLRISNAKAKKQFRWEPLQSTLEGMAESVRSPTSPEQSP